ncbi:MAG: serine hydrolase [Ancalomicrobiaceae bacterium]|nr:serine hydrolase [Ancalomicrobiaceae bacterium]
MTQSTDDDSAARQRIRPDEVNGRSGRARGVGALLRRSALGLFAASAVFLSSPASAEVGAYLVFDAGSGEVFARYNADQAWYPASITKLMTTYVIFKQIKAGRLKFTSPVVVSAKAASQPPSKMGFPPGTVLTVDNALKMIMVKSANDIAWALGESVGGSKEEFVTLMNAYARQLGMTESTWDNPNGLPDPAQVTTARDLGILAYALLKEFPEYDFYYRLPGIQLGNRVIRNHNHLMDHYPGTDGMKTGFICASGFNVVASVTRGNKRLVAVVLGASGARPRAERAADLFNRAFDSANGLFGFLGGKENIRSMAPGPEASQPVRDVRKDVCGGKRHDDSPEEAAEEELPKGALVRDTAPKGPLLTARRFDIGQPVKVWIGGADPVSADPAALARLPDSVPLSPAKPTDRPPNAAAYAEPTRSPGAILPLKPGIQAAPVADPAAAGATDPTEPAAVKPAGDKLGEDGKPMDLAAPQQPSAKPASKPAEQALKMPVPKARPDHVAHAADDQPPAKKPPPKVKPKKKLDEGQ